MTVRPFNQVPQNLLNRVIKMAAITIQRWYRRIKASDSLSIQNNVTRVPIAANFGEINRRLRNPHMRM